MKAHERLGIAADASKSEAQSAFRKLASAHHPDKGGDKLTFALLRQAFEQFTKPVVCPDCEGAGQIKKRNGWAISYIDCPRCFPATKTQEP